MNTDDWARLKALFHSALERSGADRAAFVAQVCHEHPDLQEQLRALIASHSEASAFLEEPAFAGGSLGSDVGALEAQADFETTLGVGDVLDETYEVEAMLGSGGMGVVYRVRHRGLARTFAAKLIHSRVADDPVFLERFTREAEALGKLKHPHIVDVTDFGIDRGGSRRPYLIMEYLEGQTLHDRLRSGALKPEAALPVFDAIAAAVDHAHRHGVLHLDLKPANVLMVDAPNGHAHPKILDFGLSQFVNADDVGRTSDAALRPIGTPSYIAPELLNGERPGPAADIYSLGILMYEVLAGRTPFDGSTAEILEQQRHARPPAPSSINPAIAPEMDAALVAVLRKSATERPATARDAVTLVRQAALAAAQRRWRQRETPRRLAAAAGIAIALALSSPLWESSLLRRLETQTVDARFALAAERPPGPDIVLLLLDDASLAADATPLAQRADMFGVDLERIFAAGAKATAVDFLLPESWSNSISFSQLALRHADRLTLAAFSTGAGEVVGPECISGATTVALGPERASALFGFVNLDQDDDGVSRRARLSYRDRDGGARSSFAARAASTMGAADQTRLSGGGEAFWIDHTIDAGAIDRVSWKDLDATLRTRPELFRDRLVIVGGDFSGSGDDPRVPNRGAVPGVVLQALLVDTILSNFPVTTLGTTAELIAAAITCGAFCAAILMARRPWRAAVIMLLVGTTYSVACFVFFAYARVLLPFTSPLVLSSLGAALAWWFRIYRPSFPGE